MEKDSEMKSLKPNVQTDEFIVNFDVSKFVRFGSSHLFSAGSTPMCSFSFLPPCEFQIF